jgi:hypothetical protein
LRLQIKHNTSTIFQSAQRRIEQGDDSPLLIPAQAAKLVTEQELQSYEAAGDVIIDVDDFQCKSTSTEVSNIIRLSIYSQILNYMLQLKMTHRRGYQPNFLRAAQL